MKILAPILTLVIALFMLSCGEPDPSLFTDNFKVNTDKGFVEDGNMLEGNYRIAIESYGVSSGYLKLNDGYILSPDDFKNTDFEMDIETGLYENNTLEAMVMGKPQDKLCFKVYEVNEEESESDITVIYQVCLERTKGKPQKLVATFGY